MKIIIQNLKECKMENKKLSNIDISESALKGFAQNKVIANKAVAQAIRENKLLGLSNTKTN